MSAHTPTPWMADNDRWLYSTSSPRHLIADVGFCGHALGGTPAAQAVATANARYIVRCVNTHADLLAALKRYVEHFGDPLKCARAAINAAEGRQAP